VKIILASSSPRRAEILRQAGIPFETLVTNSDESRRDRESPVELVLRLAEAKARAAASQTSGPGIVLGADTEVVVDGQVLGKPTSADDARAMLRRLSGRVHDVITGLALIKMPGDTLRSEHETTRVTFAAMSDEEITSYVATGEPFDKTGAYAIQGAGGRYVTRIEGCYFNVMGLPLARLYRMLREFGWKEE
jgi:septum formation protein